MKYLSFMILSFCSLWVSAAAVTMSYQNGTTSFDSGSNGTANYLVRADSAVPFPITLSYQTGNYPWATQVTTGTSACAGAAVCSSHFTLSPGGSCCLMLNLNGSGLAAGNYSLSPVVATTPATYKYTVLSPTPVIVTSSPAPVPGQSTLQVSPSLLGLSVNDQNTNLALTGNPRSFTITNSGQYTVTGLTVVPPAQALPQGSSYLGTCRTSLELEPGETCTLTITPGSSASNGASGASCATGIAPIPSVFSISASNAVTVSASVDVLSYQCIYQGGFIYSVDDTTSTTGSIGGKVAALTNQVTSSPGIIWSSNGQVYQSDVNNVSFDIIPFISQTSGVPTWEEARDYFDLTYANHVISPFPPVSAFANCVGALDGQCNSKNILAFYNTYNTNYGIDNMVTAGPTNPEYYAAGRCSLNIEGYTDWYLPAICELDAVHDAQGQLTCPVGAQSMVANLSSLIGDPEAETPSTSCNPPTGTDCLAGVYWSSTEYAFGPAGNAWYEFFSIPTVDDGSTQGSFGKQNTSSVRCSRALTL